MLYWIECLVQQGSYQGEGTVCVPGICGPAAAPEPERQNDSWGRIKSRY